MGRGTIQGTCEEMCPAGEVERRTRIEDIALFERPDPAVAATTAALAVKKFARNVCTSPPVPPLRARLGVGWDTLIMAH